MNHEIIYKDKSTIKNYLFEEQLKEKNIILVNVFNGCELGSRHILSFRDRINRLKKNKVVTNTFRVEYLPTNLLVT